MIAIAMVVGCSYLSIYLPSDVEAPVGVRASLVMSKIAFFPSLAFLNYQGNLRKHSGGKSEIPSISMAATACLNATQAFRGSLHSLSK